MSSILQIERKFQKLDKRHQEIIKFYDPQSRGPKHRFIKDINEDYIEDKQIYGYARFDIQGDKKEKKGKKGRVRPTNQPKITDEPKKVQPKQNRPLSHQVNNVKYAQKTKFKNRPQTSTLKRKKRPMTAKSRPITAISKNKKGRQRQRQPYRTRSGKTGTEYLTSYNQEALEYRLQLGRKYWKNTKKFDVDNTNKIRNASAMYHLLIEGSEAQNPYKSARTIRNIQTNFKQSTVHMYKHSDRKYSIPNSSKKYKRPITWKNKQTCLRQFRESYRLTTKNPKSRPFTYELYEQNYNMFDDPAYQKQVELNKPRKEKAKVADGLKLKQRAQSAYIHNVPQFRIKEEEDEMDRYMEKQMYVADDFTEEILNEGPIKEQQTEQQEELSEQLKQFQNLNTLEQAYQHKVHPSQRQKFALHRDDNEVEYDIFIDIDEIKKNPSLVKQITFQEFEKNMPIFKSHFLKYQLIQSLYQPLHYGQNIQIDNTRAVSSKSLQSLISLEFIEKIKNPMCECVFDILCVNITNLNFFLLQDLVLIDPRTFLISYMEEQYQRKFSLRQLLQTLPLTQDSMSNLRLPKNLIKKMNSKGIYYLKITQKVRQATINGQVHEQSYLEDERFYISKSSKKLQLKQKVISELIYFQLFQDIKWEIVKFFIKIVISEQIVINNELADRNSLATHLDMFKKKRPFKYKQPLRINLTKVKDIIYSIENENNKTANKIFAKRFVNNLLLKNQGQYARIHSAQYFNQKSPSRRKYKNLDQDSRNELKESLKNPNMMGATKQRIITFDQFPDALKTSAQNSKIFFQPNLPDQPGGQGNFPMSQKYEHQEAENKKKMPKISAPTQNQELGKLINKLTTQLENEFVQSPPSIYKKSGNQILKSRNFAPYKQKQRDIMKFMNKVSRDNPKVHKGSVVARQKSSERESRKLVHKKEKNVISIVGEQFLYKENEF